MLVAPLQATTLHKPRYDDIVTIATLPAAEAVADTSAWAPRMVAPPARLLRACELPRLMAENDGRGRVSGIRQFIKDWAAAGDRRVEMIASAPTAHQRWHRFTRRRFDLARIAAVVHALCDRDGVAIPTWVMQHRAGRAMCLNDRSMTDSKWDSHMREISPEACATHNVWFAPVDLDDYRVHGFR
ncbi:hypothetical protein [Candidatus Poriferisodalis sp.]|uniref:hypothetical protein n=1 Tax=Candidatus Poriferisodalis sp. TaxID=3101277 RepID=UPI003B01A72B